jgi:EAL domain-containing protein (putative c-di-GMP-specific phosphodiesterase class I)/CheY-like chemotaxis protein
MSGLVENRSVIKSEAHRISAVKSVLIVEDDADAAEELSEIIELEGWTSLTARSVKEAMEQLEASDVRLVITDVHLGGTVAGDSGIQLVSRARAMFPERDISFIVLSGDVDAVKSSLQTDAVDFLLKPVSSDDLIDALNEARRLNGTERHLSEFAEYLIRKTGKDESGDDRSSANFMTAQFSKARKQIMAAEEKAFVLQYALGADLVTTCFKPIVALEDKALVAFEAAPHVKEATGKLELHSYLDIDRGSQWSKAMDERIRRDAVEALAQTNAPQTGQPRVMVLFSAEQVTAATDILSFTRQLEKANVAPDQIVVEVSYDPSMDQASGALFKTRLSSFADRVLRVDIKHFASVCAVVPRLRAYGFDWVRLSTEGVPDWDSSPKQASEVRALIAVAKAVGIKVILDGVNSQDALDWARAVGCDAVQGQAVSRQVNAAHMGERPTQDAVVAEGLS